VSVDATVQAQDVSDGFAIPRPELHRLTGQLARLAASGTDRDRFVLDFLQLAIGLINAAGAVHFTRYGSNLAPGREMLSRQALSWSPDIRADLQKSAEAAVSSAQIHYTSLASYSAASIISCPLTGSGQVFGCLSFVILVGSRGLESFLVIVQLLASLLGVHLENMRTDDQGGDDTFSELVAVLASVLPFTDRRQSLVLLNSRLRQWSGCSLVAVGLPEASGRMELSSLSDVTTMEARTEISRAMQKGLSECAIQQDMLCWPGMETVPGYNSPVLQDLIVSTRHQQGIGVALKGKDGVAVGAVLLLWAEEGRREEIVAALRQGHDLFAASLAVLQKRHGAGIIERIRGKAAEKVGRFSRLQQWSLILVLIAVSLLMPFPFRVKTECLVQPVVTRFVVARFDGILQDVLVQPGDKVRVGEILARLDARETELELAAVVAERNKAGKTRDFHMAAGDTVAEQVARLDEQRFQEKIDLLEEKRKAMVLASPVDGIVLTGDLKRNQGSPVNKGQTLFEVAPLETMTVELAVRQESIVHVKVAQSVKVWFDAYPDRSWQGSVQRVRPKSQIYNGQNVFVAELDFANPDDNLRPGMRGDARIEAGWRPLGWIILRKPWYGLQRLFDLFF